MHRFMLAELNTHRVFSRNSASSPRDPGRTTDRTRARGSRDASRVRRQAGGDEAGPALEGDALESARTQWLVARDSAVVSARRLADLGVHKQVVNRLLEPFMWHTVIVTATDWDGFWHQRCSPLAQPEIRVVADAMRDDVRRVHTRGGRAGRLASSVHLRRRPIRDLRSGGPAEDLRGALRTGLVPQSRRPARPRRRLAVVRPVRRLTTCARVSARARRDAG